MRSQNGRLQVQVVRSPTVEAAAPIPALSEARVERQCTVNQFDCSVDVLAKVSKYVRGPSQDTWVVTCDLKYPPCQTESLTQKPVQANYPQRRTAFETHSGRLAYPAGTGL